MRFPRRRMRCANQFQSPQAILAIPTDCTPEIHRQILHEKPKSRTVLGFASAIGQMTHNVLSKAQLVEITKFAQQAKL